MVAVSEATVLLDTATGPGRMLCVGNTAQRPAPCNVHICNSPPICPEVVIFLSFNPCACVLLVGPPN